MFYSKGDQYVCSSARVATSCFFVVVVCNLLPSTVRGDSMAVGDITSLVQHRILTDRQPAQSTCVESPARWRSSAGSDCNAYIVNQYCTLNGGYGPGWRPEYGVFEGWIADGAAATGACCGCGGGIVTGTPAFPPLQEGAYPAAGVTPTSASAAPVAPIVAGSSSPAVGMSAPVAGPFSAPVAGPFSAPVAASAGPFPATVASPVAATRPWRRNGEWERAYPTPMASVAAGGAYAPAAAGAAYAAPPAQAAGAPMAYPMVAASSVPTQQWNRDGEWARANLQTGRMEPVAPAPSYTSASNVALAVRNTEKDTAQDGSASRGPHGCWPECGNTKSSPGSAAATTSLARASDAVASTAVVSTAVPTASATDTSARAVESAASSIATKSATNSLATGTPAVAADSSSGVTATSTASKTSPLTDALLNLAAKAPEATSPAGATSAAKAISGSTGSAAKSISDSAASATNTKSDEVVPPTRAVGSANEKLQLASQLADRLVGQLSSRSSTNEDFFSAEIKQLEADIKKEEQRTATVDGTPHADVAANGAKVVTGKGNAQAGGAAAAPSKGATASSQPIAAIARSGGASSPSIPIASTEAERANEVMDRSFVEEMLAAADQGI